MDKTIVIGGAAYVVVAAAYGIRAAVGWIRVFDRHYSPPKLTILREWAGMGLRSVVWPLSLLGAAVGGAVDCVRWAWALMPRFGGVIVSRELSPKEVEDFKLEWEGSFAPAKGDICSIPSGAVITSATLTIGDQSFNMKPKGGVVLMSGDDVSVSFTNTGSNTATATAVLDMHDFSEVQTKTWDGKRWRDCDCDEVEITSMDTWKEDRGRRRFICTRCGKQVIR